MVSCGSFSSTKEQSQRESLQAGNVNFKTSVPHEGAQNTETQSGCRTTSHDGKSCASDVTQRPQGRKRGNAKGKGVWNVLPSGTA